MSVAVAAVVGSVGVGMYGANKSAKSADKATKAQSEASAAQLEFEREQYDDWKELYGPIEQNLATYYQGVTPETYAAVGLETYNEEYQKSVERMNEQFAQRGILPSSGIASSLAAQGELQAAETRSGIRSQSEQQAINDKTNFLQIGMGQNPSNSLSQAYSQQSAMAATQAAAANQAAGQAWSSVASSIPNAVFAYQNSPHAQPTQPQQISTMPTTGGYYTGATYV